MIYQERQKQTEQTLDYLWSLNWYLTQGATATNPLGSSVYCLNGVQDIICMALPLNAGWSNLKIRLKGSRRRQSQILGMSAPWYHSVKVTSACLLLLNKKTNPNSKILPYFLFQHSSFMYYSMKIEVYIIQWDLAAHDRMCHPQFYSTPFDYPKTKTHV